MLWEQGSVSVTLKVKQSIIIFITIAVFIIRKNYPTVLWLENTL